MKKISLLLIGYLILNPLRVSLVCFATNNDLNYQQILNEKIEDLAKVHDSIDSLPIEMKDKQKNIGLCIMATGKYITFAASLIKSAETYFCKNHQVTYFVFTDGELLLYEVDPKKIVIMHQSKLGWPYDTLMRFKVYWDNRNKFELMDYIFACDADMLFVDIVGDEILSDLVATQHPLQKGRGTYETNKLSAACIAKHEGTHYFAGGFYGGIKREFFNLITFTMNQVEIDLEKKYIALWHDESHLNRYFVDHKPTLILCPSYCYPQGYDIPYAPKLVALQKKHQEIRA